MCFLYFLMCFRFVLKKFGFFFFGFFADDDSWFRLLIITDVSVLVNDISSLFNLMGFQFRPDFFLQVLLFQMIFGKRKLIQSYVHRNLLRFTHCQHTTGKLCFFSYQLTSSSLFFYLTVIRMKCSNTCKKSTEQTSGRNGTKTHQNNLKGHLQFKQWNVTTKYKVW